MYNDCTLVHVDLSLDKGSAVPRTTLWFHGKLDESAEVTARNICITNSEWVMLRRLILQLEGD